MGSKTAGAPVEQAAPAGSTKLAVLLSMAMFVLVFDTSLMNVSISYVVDDLDSTASGVQGTIALEALVSAAFILIGSKIGDLIGRKRAYVIGLLGYAAGALSMVFSQSLTPIILFWIKLVHEVPYTGERGVDVVGAILSALGMGGIVLGILVWQEGGSAVGALLAVGAGAMGLLAWWLRKRK